MRIRYVIKNGVLTDVRYSTVKDYAISHTTDLIGKEYWYIKDDISNWSVAAGLKFATQEDADKLIRDIYNSEADKFTIYDVSARVKELGIKLI